MKKSTPAIIIPIVAAIIGVGVFMIPSEQVCDKITDPDCDDKIEKQHEAIWSGPIAVTKYEHKLGENVFFLIRGLQSDEIGAIGVFTPNGILFKTIYYDGSKKPDFNQFIFPDTTAELDICTPEELVGIWKIVFTDKKYPALEFKIIDEYIDGGEAGIGTVC